MSILDGAYVFSADSVALWEKSVWDRYRVKILLSVIKILLTTYYMYVPWGICLYKYRGCIHTVVCIKMCH